MTGAFHSVPSLLRKDPAPTPAAAPARQSARLLGRRPPREKTSGFFLRLGGPNQRPFAGTLRRRRGEENTPPPLNRNGPSPKVAPEKGEQEASGSPSPCLREGGPPSMRGEGVFFFVLCLFQFSLLRALARPEWCHTTARAAWRVGRRAWLRAVIKAPRRVAVVAFPATDGRLGVQDGAPARCAVLPKRPGFFSS